VVGYAVRKTGTSVNGRGTGGLSKPPYLFDNFRGCSKEYPQFHSTNQANRYAGELEVGIQVCGMPTCLGNPKRLWRGINKTNLQKCELVHC
jgi:hypothetical protein